MERIFDEELKALKGRILALGGLVEEQVQRSIKALVERDSDLARGTIEEDHRVNRMEVEIDEECVRLIALRQPAAGDLRFLTTAMKIVTDLERMGDLAVDTCERALELNEEPPLKPYIDIPRMADAAQRNDIEAARALLKQGADVNAAQADGMTALHWAAVNDNVELAKM
ncbi:MAG: phosphate signaling complex protein PhoU, partial [Nitrospirae bacterium]|nr:phosphate signaling complex protein PhoU [Nitrospirota bacterium]